MKFEIHWDVPDAFPVPGQHDADQDSSDAGILDGESVGLSDGERRVDDKEGSGHRYKLGEPEPFEICRRVDQMENTTGR
ncbi:MAG: hypothetical protein JO340_04885 [Acidobacteriaceae bacterium]|nr:hypothetical protein [Acidobacteriaceae bacterium]